MEFKTFSCFDNFVRGNNAGVPDHTPMNHALQHLEKYVESSTEFVLYLTWFPPQTTAESITTPDLHTRKRDT